MKVWDGERPDSVGRPGEDSEVRILNDQGEQCEPNQEGEILLRYPHVPSRSYFGDDAATRHVFTDGWARTGDLGYVDHDGYLYCTGRIKEVISVAGHKVSVAEVEDVLRKHPAVTDCVAFGIPDAVLEEQVAAAVVVSGVATAAELRAFAAGHLVRHKVPTTILILPAIPRNSMGKELRRTLVELVRGASSRS
jgi:acyl-CoA synthetase (AMP-forming)/AMP-acid ligase II